MRSGSIILLFVVSFFWAFSSCRQEKKNKNLPRLPFAENSYSIVPNDSCLFSVAIRDSSVIFSDSAITIDIRRTELLGLLVCEELKKGNINPEKDYPVNLLIDSATPFAVYDKLIEELKLIGIHAVFLNTSDKGFKLIYPNTGPVEEVVNLYGKRFYFENNVLYKCTPEKTTVNFESDLPPPPPPPPPPAEFYCEISGNIGKLKDFNIGLLEFINGKYYFNGEAGNKKDICKMIGNSFSVFIKLDSKNNYNDLITVIDLMREVEHSKLDSCASADFNLGFSELTDDKKQIVKYKCALRYYILSLAESNYIKHKSDSHFVELNDIQ